MSIAGYLLEGKPCGVGDSYTYLFSGNGVYLAAQNNHLFARIPIADCEIRGLNNETPHIELLHGKIPGVLFDLAFDIFAADITKEKYLAITWHDGAYHLVTVEQEQKEANVKYQYIEGAVLDLHSHCNMKAMFSLQDDKDETGFRIYGVVGRLGTTPEVLLRVGVYGYFYYLPWDEIFDGSLSGAVDAAKEGEDVAIAEY